MAFPIGEKRLVLNVLLTNNVHIFVLLYMLGNSAGNFTFFYYELRQLFFFLLCNPKANTFTNTLMNSSRQQVPFDKFAALIVVTLPFSADCKSTRHFKPTLQAHCAQSPLPVGTYLLQTFLLRVKTHKSDSNQPQALDSVPISEKKYKQVQKIQCESFLDNTFNCCLAISKCQITVGNQPKERDE